MATASALIHKDRLYIGVAGKGGQFDPDGGHRFSVIDVKGKLSDSSLIYNIPVKGYPQAAALMSTSEEKKDYDNDGKPDGRVYVYFTYNAPPGGVYIENNINIKISRNKLISEIINFFDLYFIDSVDRKSVV